MTTNQTIDGVPRKYVMHLTDEAHSVLLGMVEHCLNIRACMGMDEGFKDFDTEEEHDFVKELRALLDAPAYPQVKRVKPHKHTCACVTGDSGVCDCGAVVNGLPVPAAQPQGDPVALPERSFVGDIRNPYRHTVLHDGYISGWNAYRDAMVKLGPLYAEQPAPVAMGLPERVAKKNHNSHDWDEGHADGWKAYDEELKRLNPSL